MISTFLLRQHTHDHWLTHSEQLGWSDGCLKMVKERLENLGVDMSATPPMFYPEAISHAVVIHLKKHGIEIKKK